VLEILAAQRRRQCVAVAVEEAGAQRLEHAGATVDGGRAAQSDQKPTDATIEAGEYQLAYAEAAGPHRRALRDRHLLQADHVGYLDDGSRAHRRACHKRASTLSPKALHARTDSRWMPPPRAMANKVPSPPSAIGASTISRVGNTCRSPAASAAATSTAPRLSLNESGAMTTFIAAM
jgi:hypothetical protein